MQLLFAWIAMIDPESAAEPFRACPAPWRPCPGGPDAQTLFLEQKREEELFQCILEEARQEETALNGLFGHVMRLAFPNTPEADRERALGMILSRTANWQNSFDKDGNPRWISLTLPERDEHEKGIHPDPVLPSDMESAAPPQADARETPEKNGNVSGFFARLSGIFSGIPGSGHQPATAAGRGTIPPPRPRPLRGVARLVIVGSICAVLYHALVVRGCMPRIL